MGNEQPASDGRFKAGDKLWYRTPGMSHRGEFIKASKSGKKVQIRYEYLVNDRVWTNRSYVDPKNVEPRHD